MLRTLSDAEIETDAPLEVVVWTNEEGTRFSPAMIGSGVWAGVFDLGYGATSNPASIVYRQLIRRIQNIAAPEAIVDPIRSEFTRTPICFSEKAKVFVAAPRKSGKKKN